MSKLFFVILAFLTASKAQADLSYAISRFANPLYPADFKHLKYINPEAPKGGRLRMATVGTFDSLNRFIVKGVNPELLLMTTDSLLTKSADDPYTFYALIAEKADFGKDGSFVTFQLNPKARFHDGAPITVEDVKFTFELLRDKGRPHHKKYFAKIESIKIVDPKTVRIDFKKDKDGVYDRELPFIAANVAILSKKDLEGKDFNATGLSVILGSGPYKVGKIEQGRHVIYERVKDYWAADLPINKGKYNFDEISIEYFKNEQTLREALKAGEVDTYFEVDQRQWRMGYDFPAIKSGKVVKVEMEHKRPVAVRTLIFNLKNPLFEDIRVRKAISMAFDFHRINKTLLQGTMKRMDSLFANTHFAASGKPSAKELAVLAPYKAELDPAIFEDSVCLFDCKDEAEHRKVLEEADKLLTDAGWIIENGRRVNAKTKEPLHFTFLLKDQRIEALALELSRSLKKLGIDMRVRRVDVTQYEKQAVDKTFDMIIHTWSNSLSPGIEQTYYFDPKTADQEGSSNYIGIKNPAIYALAVNAANSKTAEDLETNIRALDRAVMGMYYMIPGMYDNLICFAYWKDKLAFPEIDPAIGTNAPEWWWAVKSNA